MRKWKRSRFSMAAAFLVTTCFFSWFSCRRPTENLLVSLGSANRKPSKYHIVLEVSDAKTSRAPAGATISVTGTDASFIHSSTDAGSFKVYDGFAELELDPGHVPTDGQPVKFNVSLSANGYLTVTQEIWIRTAQFEQRVRIPMISLTNPPEGMGVSVRTLNLSNGVLPALTKVPLAAQALNARKLSAARTASASSGTGNALPDDTTFTDEDGLTTAVLPKGLTFYYYKKVGQEEKISTRKVPYLSAAMNIQTSNSNSSATIPPRILGYYDEEYTEMADILEKETVRSGNVDLVCTYYTATADVGYRIFPQDPDGQQEYSNQVAILGGGSYKENELFFQSIGVKRISNYYFVYHDKDAKGKPQDIIVSPSADFEWYISYALDQNAVNLLTGKPIAAGDAVEYAVDIVNHATKRATIVAYEVNGKTQLRTNIQCSWVGFYYSAPYKANYSYTLNNTMPSELANVPDTENLQTDVTLVDLGAGMVLYGWDASYGVNNTVSGMVLSRAPIQLQLAGGVWYFGKILSQRSLTGNTGSFSVFDSHYDLPAEVTFDVSILCTEKKVTIHPDASGPVTSAHGESRAGYCRLIGGHWATRGLVLGDSYLATGYYEGIPARYEVTIDGTNIVDQAIGNCTNVKNGVGEFSTTK